MSKERECVFLNKEEARKLIIKRRRLFGCDKEVLKKYGYRYIGIYNGKNYIYKEAIGAAHKKS